jgi:flavin reductase (DIM6/NTAB) family NADH-FMN oxidoreductase RutF
MEGGFHSSAHDEGPGAGVSAGTFKDSLARWASTVTLVAARVDYGRGILGTTVTSFFPMAAEPPLVGVSLGASAQVLPALQAGADYVVNLLARDQRRIASAYADSYPVGPSPFPDEGPPVVEGALISLLCQVVAVHPVEGGARVVVGRVEEVMDGSGEEPLLYWRRGYHGLDVG